MWSCLQITLPSYIQPPTTAVPPPITSAPQPPEELPLPASPNIQSPATFQSGSQPHDMDTDKSAAAEHQHAVSPHCRLAQHPTVDEQDMDLTDLHGTVSDIDKHGDPSTSPRCPIVYAQDVNLTDLHERDAETCRHDLEGTTAAAARPFKTSGRECMSTTAVADHDAAMVHADEISQTGPGDCSSSWVPRIAQHCSNTVPQVTLPVKMSSAINHVQQQKIGLCIYCCYCCCCSHY